MYIWAWILDGYRELGSLEFAKQMLQKAKVSVSPGIGLVTTVTTMCVLS